MITITIEQDNSGSHEDEGTYESVQAAIQQKPPPVAASGVRSCMRSEGKAAP